MTRSSGLLLALLGVGCCGQVGPCPQNDVAIVVRVDGEAAPVTVEGYEMPCVEEDGGTICRPARIAAGEYELVVSVDGFEPQPITLEVVEPRGPSFTCECQIPRGGALIELETEEPSDPDAGEEDPDAGEGDPDAGEGDPDAGA